MKKYQITPEHRIELEAIKQKYINNSRRTDPMTEHDKSQMRVAMRGLYRNANIPYPGDEKIIFVSSPLVAQFAAGFAMALLNPEQAAWQAADQAAWQAAGQESSSLSLFVSAFVSVGVKFGKFGLFSAAFAWRYRTRSALYPWQQVYGDFFKNVAKIPGDWDKWEPLNLDCLHGGVRFMTPNFTIIADRPEVLRFDEDGRLHCENGPSVKWRDGMEQYYWHGTGVPDTWIRDRSLTPEIALKWENIEQARCAQEILGLDKILTHPSVKAKLVDKNEDPHIGELYHVNLRDEIGNEGMLKVKCGTGRTFVMRVDSQYSTALEANASLGGWRPDMKTPPENFIPMVRS